MWKARLSELEFDERELNEVLNALDSAWITAGPRTQAFEKAFANLTGTAEAVAVSNGTAWHTCGNLGLLQSIHSTSLRLSGCH